MIRDGRLATPQRDLAWLVPFFTSGIAQSFPGTYAAVAALALGLLAGADWHWLNRNDVGPRLVVPALLASAAAATVAFDATALSEGPPANSLVFWTNVMVGVVLMERWMRWRERHAWRSGPTPQP